MGAIYGEELMKMESAMNGREEKILVLVRLRPLSEKEISRNEVPDWECINDTTVLFRNSLQERSMFPTAYTFDRVFGGDCTTRQVYDEGAKDIALSVVGGINSSIFAYGQTSSGKTYTMTGITEYTVADIYDYMRRHEERAFVLKFSAMEIYNEAVRDLLSSDSTPLRLLDDPDKGTVIEKLTEETLRDWSHLKELLSICEAQRRIGETLLNETSSRSHQILRLTIESSAREFIGKDKSTTLAASVNFVDLAGSERASQALSVGQRLKEGCHINRSLLTLSTVIRKLSKGRHGHVNYRDSKLTRILQPCLGGNARTGIICTLSPARDHVEQSRNTLLFASCAKEVTTNAHVNVVMSDKALVKHLQKELARLESELRTTGPSVDYSALLRKKDLQIEKLEKEVRELTKQRDLAQSRIEELLQAVRHDKHPKEQDGLDNHSFCEDGHTYEVDCSLSESLGAINPCFPDRNSKVSNTTYHQANGEDDYLSDDGSLSCKSEFLTSDRDSALRMDVDSVNTCRDVQCIETDVATYVNALDSVGISKGENENGAELGINQELSSEPSDERNEVQGGLPYHALEQRFLDVQNTLHSLITPCANKVSRSTSLANVKFSKSRSCRADITADLSSSGLDVIKNGEKTPPNGFERCFIGRPDGFQRKSWNLPPLIYSEDNPRLLRTDSQSSLGSVLAESAIAQNNGLGDEDIPSVDSFVAGLKKAKLQYGNQLLENQADIVGNNVKDGSLDPMHDSVGPTSEWPLEFERLQRLIIELWEACNVSLVHRTYFFLLFKGDPMDSIYMEVEVRRLSFLKETFSKGIKAVEDGRTLTLASSMKALRRERAMLGRLMNRRFSDEERNRLYEKWGISLNSKRRRLQLINRLWSNTKDRSHIIESTSIVARLIMFSKHGLTLNKEMFGLSFTPQRTSRRSFGWKYMTSLV